MSNTTKQRPIDPTKNAQDIIGDTSGLTGITTSSPEEGSAEPTERVPDSSNLPGTLVNEPKANPSYGVPKEATSSKIYRLNIQKGQSQEGGQKSEDTASGKDIPTSPQPSQNDYDETLAVDDVTEEQPPDDAYVSESNKGEESISGDMPVPDADADMLKNAQGVGTQMDEDSEHPQEIDIGRDIDKAEGEIRES